MVRTVLIVDDDPLVLEVTATMLDNSVSRSGASTGKELNPTRGESSHSKYPS